MERIAYTPAEFDAMRQRAEAAERDLAACKIARDGWMKSSDKAQARIRELEAERDRLREALTEIADFSEQFIGDDEDGDECMYRVNQIADTALAPNNKGDAT